MNQIYRILMLVIFFISFGICAQAQNDWVKKERYGGGKRERAVGFSIGNRGYFACGQDTANLMCNDVWEFDPASNTWTQKANFGGVARRNAVAFTIDNIAYVGTGMDNAESAFGSKLSDFWAYDPTINSWSQIASIPQNNGQGVYFATAFTLGSHGYVCGGKNGPGNYSDNLWQYKPSNDTWIQRADYPGGVRYAMASFTVGNKGYVGTGTDQDLYRKDMHCYDPGSNTWQTITDFPGVARNGATGFGIDNLGYLGLGADGGYKDDIWAYDPISDTWAVRASFGGGARRYAACFVIGNKAYAGTGKGLSGVRRNFYEYTPAIPDNVNELANDVSLSVYPNPMVNYAIIKIESSKILGDLKVEIIDLTGQIVLTENTTNGEAVQIERGDLSAGTYICRVIDSKGTSLLATEKITLR